MTELMSFGAVIAAIERTLDETRQRIIANMDAAGQRVTGRTAQSLRVEKVNDNEVRLVARPFFSALETGSRPWSGRTGNTMSAADFRDIIEQWATRKGIVPPDMTPKSFAFVVARKIMRSGSKLYRTGGRTDIFTPEVERAMKNVNDVVGATLTAQVSEIVTQILNYKQTGQWQ